MSQLAVVLVVALLVMLFIVAEIVAATLPIIVIITLVPPEDRQCLAELLAATDSSRKLRLWPALRTAVAARRIDRPGLAAREDKAETGARAQR
jgi:putative exporter of polyketide antibiotics